MPESIIQGLETNPDNNVKSKKQWSISELEKEIASIENKDRAKSICYLIQKVCMHPNLVNKPLTYLEYYISQLNDASLTPLANQELMAFYSRYARDKTKAKHYFDEFVEQINKNSSDKNEEIRFRFDRILDYVDLLFSQRDFNYRDILDVFNRIKRPQAIFTDSEYDARFEDRLFAMLSAERVYERLKPNQLRALVESVFESGIMTSSRTKKSSERLASLVMAKLIQGTQLDDGFEYWMFYMKSYRMSLLEVPMLEQFFNKFTQRKIDKKRMKTVLDVIDRTFDKQLANNVLFFAYILCNDLRNAEFVLIKKLDGKFDFEMLERLQTQFESNPVLKRQHYLRKLGNLVKLTSKYGRNDVDEKIREILKLDQK